MDNIYKRSEKVYLCYPNDWKEGSNLLSSNKGTNLESYM